jgi:hypothetical protein
LQDSFAEHPELSEHTTSASHKLASLQEYPDAQGTKLEQT